MALGRLFAPQGSEPTNGARPASQRLVGRLWGSDAQPLRSYVVLFP